MKQFVVQMFPTSVLVVDISEVGSSARPVQTHMFASWEEAERHSSASEHLRELWIRWRMP